MTGAGRVDKGAGLPIGQTVDQDQPAYQEPLACCPTRPRSRCPAAPSTTSPTSSAPTGHNYVRGGAGSTPAAKRCWCWPTYETATPTSGWPPGSASACPPPGATSTRPSTCWAGAAADAHTAAARAARLAYAILDGTLIPIDRVAADRPYYSGKHKRHGLNVQILADPRGNLVWASPALPGSQHDLNAARTHQLIEALTENQVMTFADKGYQGAGGSIRTPFKRRRHRPPLSIRQREVNASHARIRGIGERAVAALKTWRILTKLRCCP